MIMSKQTTNFVGCHHKGLITHAFILQELCWNMKRVEN